MQQTVENILSVFQNYRMEPTSVDQYETSGKKILTDRISKFVGVNEPIKFAMLGFPFKSTNKRDKVLGEEPDMAEQVSLENFARFNNDVKQHYSPGIRIGMASDGFVFNELLGVNESVVSRYMDQSQELAHNADAPVDWFTLKDFYSGSIGSAREKLFANFGTTKEEMELLILTDVDVNILYRGMIRFMEEEIAIKHYDSRNQKHKEAKRLTREMMLANEAYSRLTRHELSDWIRISMHQSVNNGKKFSFKMIPGTDTHHSAWHCVLAVSDNGTYSTLHKKDAIWRGYELMNKDGRPYFFYAKQSTT